QPRGPATYVDDARLRRDAREPEEQVVAPGPRGRRQRVGRARQRPARGAVDVHGGGGYLLPARASSSSLVIAANGTGRPRWKPWASGQPASSRKRCWASVSTPSATVVIPRPLA